MIPGSKVRSTEQSGIKISKEAEYVLNTYTYKKIK